MTDRRSHIAYRISHIANKIDYALGRIFFGSFLEFIPFFTGYGQKK